MNQTIRSENMPVQVTESVAHGPRDVRRISWGAVLSGVAVAIVTHIAMNLLGLSIGASILDPFRSQEMIVEFETATIIWIAASTLVSMFAGGWVAGRLSGITDETDSALHGLSVWAVVTLLTIFFIISGVSRVINGAADVVGAGFSLAGGAAEVIAPEVADAVNVQETTLQDIEDEARSFQNAEGRATNSQLTVALRRLLRDGADAAPETRQAVVDALVQQAGMTPADANVTVDRWVTTYQQTVDDAEAFARDAGEDAADAIAAAAGVAFMSMAIGAFAAGAGGMLGSPDQRRTMTTRMISQTHTVPGATD